VRDSSKTEELKEMNGGNLLKIEVWMLQFLRKASQVQHLKENGEIYC